MRRSAIAAVALVAALGCGRRDRAPADAEPDPLAPLHAFEEERRRATDFAHAPASDRAFGPDPIAIRAVPGSEPPRFVGLLRGRDAAVVLDASLRELGRVVAPASPVGLAIAHGNVFVTGEASPILASYALTSPEHLERIGTGVADPPTFGLRDVAAYGGGRDGQLYLLDERTGTLHVEAGPGRGRPIPACAGAFRLAVAGAALIVDCLLDHRLAIFDIDPKDGPAGEPRAVIEHDGPIWSVDAVDTKEGTLIAAGGVEDHPLDRAEGAFGFVDSFVFLYRLAPGAGKAEKLAEINVSEHGVITPKALILRLEGGAPRLTVSGYGGDRLAEIGFPRGFAAPSVSTRAVPPGIASLAVAGDGLVAADPLLDAWIAIPPEGDARVVPVPDPGAPARSTDARVGEALFFTRLMAPWNKTEGRLSRFTCETCHFEGGVDGRTHHTGRGDVHATTKTLRGLLNNRPYFSRALDPDMATMVNNEFRVAGAKSEHEPWFAAKDTGLPWLPLLGAGVEELDAIGLRRALMAFLADLTHRPNPAVLGRERLDDRERAGAALFAARCERCHEARLVADDASTRVPRERWEALVLSREGPIVWARDGYHRTGVEPYVHEEGARAPSLRRVWAKRPYFTNGAAKTIGDVLGRARWQGERFWHDGAPEGAEALGEADRAAIAAFLELL